MPSELWLAATQLITQAEEKGIKILVCAYPECTHTAKVTFPPRVRNLISHVTEEHGPGHATGIVGVVEVPLVSGYQLSEQLGLKPNSKREIAWREDPREKAAFIMQRMLEEVRAHNAQLEQLSAELEQLGYPPLKD